MQLLVTGARGFIGRHVVSRATARGHAVRMLLQRPPVDPAGLAGADYVVHDIRESSGLARALEGIDAVVHCAALMGGSAEDQHDVTVRGTENLLAAMDSAGVSGIVGLSSFAVYDYLAIPAGSPLDERSPLESAFIDRAPYVRVKLQQEEMIRERAGRRGWRHVILRLGIVFGRSRTWFHHLGIHAHPRLWIGLAGASLLPLTYVENSADAIVRAAERKEAAGTVLNVVDDNLPERRTYLRALARRSQPSPTILDIPWDLLSAGANLASGLDRRLLGGRMPLPDLARPASLHARCKPLSYPNARAKDVLDWTPAVTLEEGLDRS